MNLPIASLILFSLISSVSSRAQLIIKPTHDFDLTGDARDSSWSTAPWITLEKRSGELPYQTRVKLLYSTKGIYILFHCEDRKITATLQDDFSDLWKEDVVEIFFWTDEKTPLYFEYELSPLNKELAILVPNFDGEFLGWRPWKYEGDRKARHMVTIEKDPDGNISGWVGEIFIPYSLLSPLRNVPPEKGTQWRMNIYRIDYDGSQITSWVWQRVRANFHDYEMFGTARFD